MSDGMEMSVMCVVRSSTGQSIHRASKHLLFPFSCWCWDIQSRLLLLERMKANPHLPSKLISWPQRKYPGLCGRIWQVERGTTYSRTPPPIFSILKPEHDLHIDHLSLASSYVSTTNIPSFTKPTSRWTKPLLISIIKPNALPIFSNLITTFHWPYLHKSFPVCYIPAKKKFISLQALLFSSTVPPMQWVLPEHLPNEKMNARQRTRG